MSGEHHVLLERQKSSSSWADDASAADRITLQADDVCFSRYVDDESVALPLRPFSGKIEKKILHHISVDFRPGQLTAIMGPSGSGKTTLLNVLAARADGATTGDVLVNGRKLANKEMRMILKVVPQDDILIDSLSPYDILYYAYELVFGGALDDRERDAAIHSLLSKLGIAHVASVHVGNSLNPGLSGGQRKRTSIALELISNPGLLFLDEPTSGLDSRTAFELVQMLQEFSRNGRTIICTIHQPSYEVFTMFDRLLLLESGRVAYDGDVKNVVRYFADAGYECPMYHNPADYVFEVMAKEREKSPNFFASLWERKGVESIGGENEKKGKNHFASDRPSINREREKEFELDMGSVDFGYSTSWFRQFVTLLRRSVYMTLTDKQQFRGRLAAIVMVALFFGLVYFQLAVSQQTVQDRISVLFSMLMFTGMNMMMMTVMMFPLEREVITREFQNGNYSVSAYYFSRLISTWMFQCIYSAVYLVILYFMVGLYYSIVRFAITYSTILLVSCLSVTIGIFIGAWIPSPQLVPNVVAPILMPLIVLSGFLIQPDNIPIWFLWLHDISFFNYGLQMLMQAQFRDLVLGTCIPRRDPLFICPFGISYCDDTPINTTFPIELNSTSCVTGDTVLSYYGFDNLTIWEDAVILGSLLVGFSLFGWIIMHWRVSRPIG